MALCHHCNVTNGCYFDFSTGHLQYNMSNCCYYNAVCSENIILSPQNQTACIVTSLDSVLAGRLSIKKAESYYWRYIDYVVIVNHAGPWFGHDLHYWIFTCSQKTQNTEQGKTLTSFFDSLPIPALIMSVRFSDKRLAHLMASVQSLEVLSMVWKAKKQLAVTPRNIDETKFSLKQAHQILASYIYLFYF